VIKCVIWDLDNTLLDGVYLESNGGPPAANAELTVVLHELAGRGILQAIASKNPPEACQHAAQATGHAFAAAQCGWGAKSAAITAITDELGLTVGEVAFVDDDPLERAEVSFSLPDVLVLAPDDVPEASAWPQFSPPVVTAEARRRGELYLQRRARQEEAKAFGGSRDEFLRYCQTTVTIGAASTGDVARLHELSVRTHQFNSTGTSVPAAEFAALLASPGDRVVAVRLSDRFGDDGLVGACVLATGPEAKSRPGAPDWQVELLMVSCRALGRGVIDALLTWICRAAQAAGSARVTLPCVLSPRNVPLRIALTGAGFRTSSQAVTGQVAEYARDLSEPLAALPGWVVTAGLADLTGELRRLLAELTGDPLALTAPLDTALLRNGIGLDSLGGTMLLTEIERRYGVDIAADDLNLDALASIGTLAAYLTARCQGGER
jgi:methoxymalonate biosynthesis protein